MKKPYLIFLSLIFFLFVLCSCGNTKAEPKESKNSEKTVDTTALMNRMLSDVKNLPSMDTFTSEDKDAQSTFEYLCDLDYIKVNSFRITYSAEATADEIFIIELKDANDAETAKEALKARKETRHTAFNTYLPSEVNRVDAGLIASYGKYVTLVICDNPQASVDAFLAFFEE